MVAVVGRLVPHKRVEHAIDAVLELRDRHPGLRLHVVGGGWWEARLHEYAAQRGAGDSVIFEGHVDEARKHEVYERAWLLALPSLKEGWGLVVGEAGMHSTPTVAYRDAGGTQESVVDGYSGVLADDRAGFTQAISALLEDEEQRARLGRGAQVTSQAFTWGHAQESFATVMRAVLEGRRLDAQDPETAGPDPEEPGA
jgi:glycosyltransferase involved in cell wall biosynthesis